MGASQSQDFEPKHKRNNVESKYRDSNVPVRPLTERTTDPKLVVEPKMLKRCKRIQLPFNYESILKDADSPVDTSDIVKLLSQLQSGVFLNQKRKMYWVDKNNKNCFVLFARDLSITWGENKRHWHWTYQKETTSDVFIKVAELVQVCWLELVGTFKVSKLSPGILYQVVFIVMLREAAYGWEVPVTFKLTLPNGQKMKRKEILMDKPRGNWIEIPIGEFEAPYENGGELEIYIHEYDAGEWKGGLVVKGVAIQPKNIISL